MDTSLGIIPNMLHGTRGAKTSLFLHNCNLSRGQDGRRRPQQPTNTRYKAANIENKYSGAAPLFTVWGEL